MSFWPQTTDPTLGKSNQKYDSTTHKKVKVEGTDHITQEVPGVFDQMLENDNSGTLESIHPNMRFMRIVTYPRSRYMKSAEIKVYDTLFAFVWPAVSGDYIMTPALMPPKSTSRKGRIGDQIKLIGMQQFIQVYGAVTSGDPVTNVQPIQSTFVCDQWMFNEAQLNDPDNSDIDLMYESTEPTIYIRPRNVNALKRYDHMFRQYSQYDRIKAGDGTVSQAVMPHNEVYTTLNHVVHLSGDTAPNVKSFDHLPVTVFLRTAAAEPNTAPDSYTIKMYTRLFFVDY